MTEKRVPYIRLASAVIVGKKTIAQVAKEYSVSLADVVKAVEAYQTVLKPPEKER